LGGHFNEWPSEYIVVDPFSLYQIMEHGGKSSYFYLLLTETLKNTNFRQ